jgi:hypothetical protein
MVRMLPNLHQRHKDIPLSRKSAESALSAGGNAPPTCRRLDIEVRPIDVSSIYRLNGSLGCLVNVIAR